MGTPASIVVGGGITGLLAAWLLARKGHQVTLLEREREPGGLLRSFDYGEFGRFDYGAHNIGETGVAALDAMLFALLPPEDWQVLEGVKRDLAGTFFRGALSPGSVYPDLRRLPRESYLACVGEFFENLDAGRMPPEVDAQSFLIGRYGETIGRSILGAVVEKLFYRDAAELDVFATKLTSLDRVVLFDEPLTNALYGAPTLRASLAYPEQRRLPARFASGRRVLYPKRYGMHRVIDALCRELNALSVELKCGAALSGIVEEDGRISTVEAVDANGRTLLRVTGVLVWSTGWIPLAAVLGDRTSADAVDRPPRTVLANLLLDRPPSCGGVYYFYCYDQGFRTFRVTDFSAFCDGAARVHGYPVCLEMLYDPAHDPAPTEVSHRAVDELLRLGVVQRADHIVFNKVEALTSGFPMPSLRNVRALEHARDRVQARNLTNLVTVGIFARPGLFFQRDVLSHAYEAVRSL